MAKKKEITTRQKISNLLGSTNHEIYEGLGQVSEEDQKRLATVLLRPDLNVRYHAPTSTVTLFTAYGSILLDSSNLTKVKSAYVNGMEYSILPDLDGLDALEHLTGSYGEVMLALDEPKSRQRTGRRERRSRRQVPDDRSYTEIQAAAYEDLSRAGLTYQNFFQELGDVIGTANGGFTAQTLMTELLEEGVQEMDIARYLIYDSFHQRDVIAKLYQYRTDDIQGERHYTEVLANDGSFAGRLVAGLGFASGQYDEAAGVLYFPEDDRAITNLPVVDKNGVFHNGKTAYIPHYLGYFAEGEGSRVERLRLIDPVDQAITGAMLSYKMTSKGDVRFQTILDVTRNLPDFENHPYGDEILETLKRKVALTSRYHNTNSFLAETRNAADELGAVALTMLDDDAKGVIDPLGTSNGSNMGMIFYLTKDAEVLPDGRIVAGESSYSPVGEIIAAHQANWDNFNRNQMSFNAMLTSLDAREANVFVGEFALWNMEDGCVLTHDFDGTIKVGDKLMDMHGNKSTVSLILLNATEEEIKEKHLEHAVQFAKDNPNVDIITSPSSLASRLNMGILYEGAAPDKVKGDVKLPNGEVVKDGQTSLTYMRLSQTAEHKSKDYAIEGAGRRYSTLLRHSLQAKVGDLYTKAFVTEEERNAHIEEIARSFGRLGVSFTDESKLLEKGNVKLSVDADVTTSAADYQFMTPATVRLSLQKKLQNASSVNILLGDRYVTNRFTGEPIRDSEGRNVLPIQVQKGAIIPYRYTSVFTELASGNQNRLEAAYQKAAAVDYKALTEKDNLLKNIETVRFYDNARTTVIVPDPSLPLDSVRSNVDDSRLLSHRDPATQCGNALSMNNKRGAAPHCLHMNPLMINMQDGDFDGDTEGENAYKNLRLSEEEKDEFFARSSVEDRVNYYGEVHLGTGSSYFKALCKVNGIDRSDITFADGKSSREVMDLVEAKTRQILDSPNSYGAYPIVFTNEQTAAASIKRMAEDGLKGNVADIEHYVEIPYSREENREIAKALCAKSEWTGLAGATTNSFIANLGGEHKDLLRTGMDVTWTMTQSTLQMKKNADKLPMIDNSIKVMKRVMNGEMGVEESRRALKSCTEGLIPEAAIDEFVDKVAAVQTPGEAFGYGVLNHKEADTSRIAYMGNAAFDKAVRALSEGGQEQGM